MQKQKTKSLPPIPEEFTPSFSNPDEAFAVLGNHLNRLGLVKAKCADWMYMHDEGNCHAFKNIITRKYIFIRK